MNSTEIFTLALGLQDPWHITHVSLTTDDHSIKELHLDIAFKKGTKFKDKTGELCPVHDTKDKQWRHMNFFEHKTFINAKAPRIKTTDNKVRMIDVPWARKNSGFTLLFEALAMSLIKKEMPVNKIGRLLGEDAHRIWTIFNHWINKAYKQDDPSSITKIGIDEISKRKGHNYITVAVDLDSNRSELITLLPTIGEAYRLKLLFNDLWDMPDKQSARAFIDDWIEQVEKSKIIGFDKFCNTIREHMTGIINFVETRITNAILESINNKIQMAKRRARGYRNMSGFR